MKICILSKDDWSNSGNKLADAINTGSNRKHYAKCFCLNSHKWFLNRITIDNIDKNYVIDYLDSCDWIIYKGDNGIINPFGGYIIPKSKKIAVLFCGTSFLTNHRKILQDLNSRVDKVLAYRPDLCFTKDIDYIPHPINCDYWKSITTDRGDDNRIVIGHSISNKEQRSLKGTDFIEKVINSNAFKDKIKYIKISGLPLEEAKKLKEKCDIYIDNIGFRYYGNNGVESMALGLPTITGLHKSLRNTYIQNLDKVGFIHATECDLGTILNGLITCDKTYGLWSEKARKYAIEIHSYEAVCKTLINSLST